MSTSCLSKSGELLGQSCCRAPRDRMSRHRRRPGAVLLRSVQMHKETGKSPTPAGGQKVVMSDKRQQINLKLEPELARALRDLKQGHDESLSEVVIRLLRKLVRLNPAGARGARFSNPKGGGRGAFGADRRGKAMAPGRTAPRGAGKGKPFVRREEPPAEGAAAEDGQRESGGWAPRAVRQRTGKAGKPFRPQPLDGSSKTWRRDLESPKRTRAAGSRSHRTNDERIAGERPKRPRKAKGRRSGRS
jgi:hypothetical protein